MSQLLHSSLPDHLSRIGLQWSASSGESEVSFDSEVLECPSACNARAERAVTSLAVERCMSVMQSGTQMIKLKRGAKGLVRLFYLDEHRTRLRWRPSRKSEKAKSKSSLEFFAGLDGSCWVGSVGAPYLWDLHMFAGFGVSC